MEPYVKTKDIWKEITMLAFAPRGVFLYYHLFCIMLRYEENLDLTNRMHSPKYN